MPLIRTPDHLPYKASLIRTFFSLSFTFKLCKYTGGRFIIVVRKATLVWEGVNLGVKGRAVVREQGFMFERSLRGPAVRVPDRIRLVVVCAMAFMVVKGLPKNGST